MSFLKKFGSRMRFPLLALPAVAVTVFSLIALLSVTVQVAAASQPGDLLYPLRQPALQIRGALTFGADIRSGINLPFIADESEPGNTDDTVKPSDEPTDDQQPPSPAFTNPPPATPTLTATPTIELTQAPEPTATEKAEEPTETPDDGGDDDDDDNGDDNGDDDSDDDGDSDDDSDDDNDDDDGDDDDGDSDDDGDDDDDD